MKIPIALSGGVLLILVVFYWPFLSGQGSFFLSDATFWLEPQARYLRESIWSGRFPLWNPWNYCGMPQIAIPFPSLFYLPDWLFVLFPFNPALALSMIFHQLLALVGMFAMLRNFKISEIGSAGGALIYSLNGYMFGLSNNHSLVAGAAWFPILFLTLQRVVSSKTERQRFTFCVASSLSLLMIIASGRPEVFVPSILVSSIAAFWQAFVETKSKEQKIASLIWLFRSHFLGVVFAMPILLPMGEWLASSRRALGLYPQEVFLYSANWYDLLSCIIGPVLGDLRLHGNPFRHLVSFSNLPAYVACGYVGPVTILLALIGIFDKNWNKGIRILISALFTLSLLAALGDTTSIATFFVHIFPAAGFIRFPIKLLFIPMWCISLFAAKGLDCAKNETASNTVPFMFTVVCFCGATTLLLACRNENLIYTFRYPIKNIEIMIKAQELIGVGILVTSIQLLIVCYLMHLSKKHSFKLLPIFCIAFVFSNLILNSFKLEHIFASADHFEKPSFVAKEIQRIVKENPSNTANRSLNLTYERLTVPDKFRFKDPLQRTIGELQYHRQIIRPNTNVDFHIPETFGFEGSMNGENFNVFFTTYFYSNQTIKPEITPPSILPLERFAAISSSRFLITQIFRLNNNLELVKELPKSQFTKLVEDFTHNIRIYETRNCVNHYFLTNHLVKQKKHNEVMNEIVSCSEPGWKPWLSSYAEVEIKDQLSTTNEPKPYNQIQIISKTPECLNLTIESPQKNYLVVSDRMYPGWKAYLNGTPVAIFSVNGFYKGIFVPPGAHKVTFKYEPGSLYLGLLIASFGISLTLYFNWQSKKNYGIKFGIT